MSGSETSTVTLGAALEALVSIAVAAGIDPDTARHEGEALAATVAEPSRGAFVDWSEQTGRPTSAEAFTDAASRGRRFRSAPTASMSRLAAGGSSQAPTYAAALGDVALAGAALGEANPRATGNAATAAAAQLGESSPREFVPNVGDDVARSLVDQLSVVQRKLAGFQNAPVPSGAPSVEEVVQRPSRDHGDATQTAAPAEPVEETPPEPEKPKKSVEELLAELDDLVGLGAVKDEIHRQAAVLRVEGLRRDAGLTSPTITRHLVFNGNPGTGKTTVARLVAGIYQALGLLSKGQLVEVDRSELVAGFLGQTATKTSDVVKSAEGGVLFIDEAYSLAGDQYGTEAIDTLVKEMEDKRDDLVVIVAGYPAPMEVFIAQNPGLASRFRTTLDFVDYTDDELVAIFAVMAARAEYDADDEVLARLRAVLVGVERGPTFGNARYVRNMLEAGIGRHAWRLRDVEAPTLEQLRLLEADDLDEAPEIDPPDVEDPDVAAEIVDPFAPDLDPHGTTPVSPRPTDEETP